jgi:hypothetical protein
VSWTGWSQLLRHSQDAVSGFVPPPDVRRQVLIPPDGAEIIAHHDLGPWNLVPVTGRRVRGFMVGLLADLTRKNCWTIGEHAATPVVPGCGAC